MVETGSRNKCCFKHVCKAAVFLGKSHAFHAGWYLNLATTTFSRLFVSCRAWPDISSINPKWKKIEYPLFTLLLQKKVVYTPAHLGQWLTAEKAVFDLLSEDEPKELLQRVLLTGGVSVVSVPSHVTEAITSHAATTVKSMTPSRIRATLKKDPRCYKKLVRPEKLLLLQFCLKDCKFEDLYDLNLLPLFDGTFTTFSNRREKIYICSPNHPRELFPGLEHRFIDDTIDEDIIGSLKDAAYQGKTIFLDTSMILSYQAFVYSLYGYRQSLMRSFHRSYCRGQSRTALQQTS